MKIIENKTKPKIFAKDHKKTEASLPMELPFLQIKKNVGSLVLLGFSRIKNPTIPFIHNVFIICQMCLIFNIKTKEHETKQ